MTPNSGQRLRDLEERGEIRATGADENWKMQDGTKLLACKTPTIISDRYPQKRPGIEVERTDRGLKCRRPDRTYSET